VHKKGSWTARKVTVTAIFGLSLLYGASELLRGGGRPSSQQTSAVAPQPAGPTGTSAADTAPVQEVHPSVCVRGPSDEVIQEARLWRERDWEGINPFAGESWLGTEEVVEPQEKFSGDDPVLRATSRSSEGWRAVVGNQVVTVGDKVFGGRVVMISEGKVVIRGMNWEKVLQFTQERGQ
jgi:hypothetical protein